MLGRFSKRPTSESLPLQEVSPALFRHQRLWRRLAAYRPLLILAGIWVVLLAIALVAYKQLLYTIDTPPVTATAPRETQPAPQQESASPAPVPPVDEEVESAPEESDVTVDLPLDDPTISPWSLALLVVTCAVGCVVISQQARRPPRTRSRRKRPTPGRYRPLSGMAAAPSPTLSPALARPTQRRTTIPPASPQRLAPYRPGPSLGGTPVADPSLIAAPIQPPAAPPPDEPAAALPETPEAPDVTVVSAEFQHPLDWPEESLVKTADVRQRRSLSSFL